MESQRSAVSVISSQFCIRIEDDEIELVYDHGHQMLTVYVNTTLVIQSKYYPTRNTFNYVNLIDIAAKMRTHHYKKKDQDQKNLHH